MKIWRSKKFIGAFVVIVLIAIPAFASETAGHATMSHRMTHLVLGLAVIVLAARICGYIFQRYLKQPSVLGELCAGMIIGPYALGSIDLPMIGPLFKMSEMLHPVSPELYGIATVASVVLLFLVGLETDMSTFLRYSVAGSVIGIGGMIGSFILGDLLTVAFGFADGFMDTTALFVGAISTATSVGITARILSERKKLDSPEGVTILSAAVIDDVLGIVLMAVIVGIAKKGGVGSGSVNWANLGIVAAKAVGFWIIFTLLGFFLARHISTVLKWFRSQEMIPSMALGLALLLAGLSELAGLAMIIGAYIMGLSLSRTDVVNEIHDRLRSVYQFLVPIFFCVMGMMVDFRSMKGALLFGITYTVLVMFGKVIGCTIPALAMKFNLRGALRIGIGMLPRGEVTLIITGIGLSMGVIGSDIFGVAIMMTLISTLIAPPLLLKAFDGGPGIDPEKAEVESAGEHKITLNFPHVDIAEFVLSRLVRAFTNEAFFVHRVDPRLPIYQLRKDDIVMTLLRNQSDVVIETTARNERIARFVIAEEMLELEEAFESLKQMGGTHKISADLLCGALGWKA